MGCLAAWGWEHFAQDWEMGFEALYLLLLIQFLPLVWLCLESCFMIALLNNVMPMVLDFLVVCSEIIPFLEIPFLPKLSGKLCRVLSARWG
jgi:hypothetical protein